ncbi:Secreted protein [Burkholderia sp. IT-111MI5]
MTRFSYVGAFAVATANVCKRSFRCSNRPKQYVCRNVHQALKQSRRSNCQLFQKQEQSLMCLIYMDFSTLLPFRDTLFFKLSCVDGTELFSNPQQITMNHLRGESQR